MVASENAHAHDGDGDRTLRWQEKFSMAGCRKQIVNGIPGKSIWINVFVATRSCSEINSPHPAQGVLLTGTAFNVAQRPQTCTQPWKSGLSRAA
jgi:hypothetical protein